MNRGSAALWQSLKKLKTRASLMMITAHPDDEDGGMLTYESRGRGTRVSMLTLNRGEGGANVMSPHFYDALGLLRTQELLAADAYYGVNQYFTRVIDYGFSKTMDESMSHWTRERVLADAVRAVRLARPLVVTSVFVGGPSDGHGNHQTAGAIAQEVIRAAGDARRFPGLPPWTPRKSYARMPRSLGNQYKVAVEVPVGMYDPVLGASYVQIAREGLGMQKSQNGGPNIPRAGAAQSSAYHRFGAEGKEASFFDGIDTSLLGIAEWTEKPKFLLDGLRAMDAAATEASAQFSAPQPERCAPALAKGLQTTRRLIFDVIASNVVSKDDVLHELRIKETQFQTALAQALGLSLTAVVAPEQEPNPRMAAFMGEPETLRMVTPGQTFGVRVYPAGSAATLKETAVASAYGPAWKVDRVDEGKFTVTVPPGAAFTRPYFARPDLEQSYYDIADDALLSQPLAPYPLTGSATWTYEGVQVTLTSVVQAVKRVNGLGTVYEPLIAAPALSVKIPQRFGIVPLGAKSFPVQAMVRSNLKGAAKGTLSLELPAGWKSAPESAAFELKQEGEERAVTFMVTAGALEAGKQYTLTAAASQGAKVYREGFEMIGYPGLRPYPLYRPATHGLSAVDVKVAPGLKVGYIPGSGDEIPAGLSQLGIKVDVLSESSDFGKYDAIVLGIRAYAARPELAAANQRLLDYAQAGGVVIVQYNTPEFDRNFGPFPYVMGNNPEEVTNEASKVTMLVPGHAMFQWPNTITAKDFEGWVEERGSKWMKSWDPRYEALLETNDKGQDPQRGGMLYAKHGKGAWVYCAWAFYRQLPEGVGGAYRLFANIVSLPKNPRR